MTHSSESNPPQQEIARTNFGQNRGSGFAMLGTLLRLFMCELPNSDHQPPSPTRFLLNHDFLSFPNEEGLRKKNLLFVLLLYMIALEPNRTLSIVSGYFVPFFLQGKCKLARQKTSLLMIAFIRNIHHHCGGSRLDHQKSEHQQQ